MIGLVGTILLSTPAYTTNDEPPIPDPPPSNPFLQQAFIADDDITLALYVGIAITGNRAIRVWAEKPELGTHEWRGKVQDVGSGKGFYFRGWQALVELLQTFVSNDNEESQ